jgi:hypothetical protein
MPPVQMSTRRDVLAALLAGITVLSGSLSTAAQAGIADDFLARLSGTQRQQFIAWRTSHKVFDAKLDAYWAAVETKRAERRKKKAAKLDLVSADYVQTLPPTYDGPQLPPDLLKAWNAFVAEEEAKQPPPPVKEIPSLEDFLGYARSGVNP